MSTDPAAIPAMTVTSTALGFGSTMTTVRPAHRAVMTGVTSAANLKVKAGIDPQPEHGAHWAPLTGWTAWLAEEAAQVREIIRTVSS